MIIFPGTLRTARNIKIPLMSVYKQRGRQSDVYPLFRVIFRLFKNYRSEPVRPQLTFAFRVKSPFRCRRYCSPATTRSRATDELLPTVVRALIVGLLIGTEARLLHAHERSAACRNQRPDNDAPQPNELQL